MAGQDDFTDEVAKGCFNGVNAVTGEYLMPALTPRQMAALAAKERLNIDERSRTMRPCTE